jgi:MazG family protein
MDLDEAETAFRELVSVIRALRTPGTGCPWDLEQNHRTLRPYVIEEAYEVLDAIDRGDDRALREELGDLLLQVVLHAQVASDRGVFSIAEVIQDIAQKMVRRHPHVFGTTQVSGSTEVVRNWEQIKAAEKGAAGRAVSAAEALARIPDALPALLRAHRLGEKAARGHFAEASLADELSNAREKLAALGSAVQPDREQGAAHAGLECELGDLLFSLCQVARRLGLSAEDSLRAANRRFVESCRNQEAIRENPSAP